MTLLRMLSFRPAASSESKDSKTAMRHTSEQISTKAIPQANSKVKKNHESIENLVISDEVWPALIENLGLQGVTYSLASNCSVDSVTDNVVTLHLTQQHEGIATKGARQRLEDALQDYYSKEVKLKFDISDNELETPARKKDRVRE